MYDPPKCLIFCASLPSLQIALEVLNTIRYYLKGPKHDQIECGFFYINPSSMDR